MKIKYLFGLLEKEERNERALKHTNRKNRNNHKQYIRFRTYKQWYKKNRKYREEQADRLLNAIAVPDCMFEKITIEWWNYV